MDDAVDSFRVEEIEQDIFRQLKLFLIKNLDLDSKGNIKRTSKNMKTINRVKTLRGIILSDAYKAKVGKFISTFNTVKSLSDELITKM